MNKWFSRVGQGTFLDEQNFPWIAQVQAQTDKIKSELESLLQHENVPSFQEVSVEQKVITDDDRWKTFFLYAYGHRVDENCRKCPQTVEALSIIPGIKTAMFSILEPYKEIPPHRGPYNGVLRYHLGLIIPTETDQCGIQVGESVREWEQGASLVFDDSYQHHAWNRSAQQRVILFVDFERPLYPPVNYLNKVIIRLIGRSPFVQNALDNIRRLREQAQQNAPDR